MTKTVYSNYFLPYNPALKTIARNLRKNMTRAEKHLWYDYLSGHQYRFLRQRPIDQYVVDFYCPALKLVIEVDGDSHFEDLAEEKDSIRTSVLEGLGLRVVRFTNGDILEGFDGVVETIETLLGEVRASMLQADGEKRDPPYPP